MTNERVLIGSSLGGLFTLYIMFSDPEIFQYYISTSPVSNWDDDYLYDLSKDFAVKSRDKSLRLFMAEGELESSLPDLYKFVEFMESQQFPALSYQSKILEGIGHSGVIAEGITRGLQFVFKRP